jgi:ABC-type glycerol-3-phosphate transport system substrate-binding protein
VSAIGKVAADIKKASPEAKLERAAEAAEAAAQAADEMAAAYHNLVDSLEGIDSQYDTIEDMVYGTKEWQKAVEAVNDEVLELIEEYPELAKFVKNKDGILTIDMDSAEVQ